MEPLKSFQTGGGIRTETDMLKKQKWPELWLHEADDFPDGFQFSFCYDIIIEHMGINSFIAIFTPFLMHHNLFC